MKYAVNTYALSGSNVD